MNNKKEKNQPAKSVAVSNVFSTLAGTAAACCSGPGIVACSTVCAPTCGSLGFSVFGLSSTVFTQWLSNYWVWFLVISLVSFSFAFYKLFIKPNCQTSRTSKIVFLSCFLFSALLILKSSLTC